ncbi:MAG TPA: SIS domain-containing protein [Actinomycetales bacterium]|nr:SIS domain-containing protein [Actinomycetales bacterium]
MSALDERLLGDGDALAAADPSGVLVALAGGGAQVRRAAELAHDSALSAWTPDERPRSVVVVARGGSAVVADAVAALIGAAGPVPVVPRTGGRLPAWVGALDLVVAVSLSGRAEQAVALAVEAGRRGARLLTVGAASSPLAEACEQARGVHVPLPEAGREATSAPTSRTALWSLLVPPLVACEQLGLLPETSSGLEQVATRLEEEAESCRPSSEVFTNPAKSLALELAGNVPVLLGDGATMAVVARRAASVLARTARVPAVHGSLPDDAGEVVATFGGDFAATSEADVFADPFTDGPPAPKMRLVLLSTGEASAGAEVVRSIAERAGVRTSDVVADDGPRLVALAQLLARTDFAATYLALGSGFDPAISPHVADLRDALR